VNLLAGPLFIALGVLVVAGAAKLVRPSPTAAALGALHVPQPLLAARALGATEVALGIATAVTGEPLLFAGVAIAYGAFTIFILWALNGNQDVVSCGCFGHEDTPPTPGHVAFNAAAAATAALAVIDPVAIADLDGTVAQQILTVALIGLGIVLVIAALTALPRTLAIARGTAPAAIPTFSINSRGTS